MAAYKFAFFLTLDAGNKTRYANLRQFADLDTTVDIIWVPLGGFPPPEFAGKFAFLPDIWVSRLWTLRRVSPVFTRLRHFDAIMVHSFEAETLLVLAGYVGRIPVVVSSTDEAPIVDESKYPLYDYQLAKTARRRRFRLKMDLWRAKRIDFFMPFTRWVGNILIDSCGVPANRIMPVHVGLDLAAWKRLPLTETTAQAKPKILFVGAEFARKGGELLLAVFLEHLADVAELHIVSGEAPTTQYPGVFSYKRFAPNSSGLRQLYSDCAVLALPTTADLVPWVFLEAMAMEMPCIGTSVGAIAEVVEHGVTGLIIPPQDGPALRAALLELLLSPELRRQMGRAGREKVERDFDATKNVPKILSTLKGLVDTRRAEAGH